MEKYNYGFFPGPVSVPERIIRMSNNNYGSADVEPEFFELYKRCSGNLQKIFNTQNDVVVMTGEGMLVLWSGIKSCLQKGDRVLCISTGLFGTGMIDMAKAVGCETDSVIFPSDCSFEDMDLIEIKIADFRPKMITAVHCETPSGILNDMTRLGELKKKYNIPLFYVDAVSSVGGTHVDVDKHNIDICLGGSQKVMSCPPNSCFMSVSARAWEFAEEINYQGYDALLPFRDAAEHGYFPYTQSWVNIAQLNEAAEMILEEGLDNAIKRHEMCAEEIRSRLKSAGIKLFPREERSSSPTVTAAYVPEGYTWDVFDKKMRDKGIVLGGNYGDLAGKVFRVGHMGSQANINTIKKIWNLL